MRNNYAIITTSSYDRSLEHLLKIWPQVKKEVPQAELHIFYGWQLFEKFYRDNPASMTWKANVDKLMQQDGITHHGRISQPELKKWYEKCGIWAYPTHFGEISCISAMKAQAYGAIPVCTNFAALQETVQYGVKVDGDIYEKKTLDLFKDELVKLLKDHKRQEKIRPEMMKWAQDKFSWTKVAQQWDKEFKSDELKEATETLMSKDKDIEKYLPVQLQEKYGYQQSY